MSHFAEKVSLEGKSHREDLAGKVSPGTLGSEMVNLKIFHFKWKVSIWHRQVTDKFFNSFNKFSHSFKKFSNSQQIRKNLKLKVFELRVEVPELQSSTLNPKRESKLFPHFSGDLNQVSQLESLNWKVSTGES